MPFFRQAAQLAAIVAALAVAVFVLVTALKKPTSSVVDEKVDPLKAVFPDTAPKKPAFPSPAPAAPKVFGITAGKRSPLGEGGPVSSD
ncbi:MAG: hypothetical protein HY925_01045 [Elusimicrobia bacterium]|nr:hypothetical protein [Elusimicrobiota bacterium]